MKKQWGIRVTHVSTIHSALSITFCRWYAREQDRDRALREMQARDRPGVKFGMYRDCTLEPVDR